jgi:hypothetical protein
VPQAGAHVALAFARPRAPAMISPQVSSTVEVPPPAERVWLTGMPRALHASVSRLGERAPVRLMNFRFGRRSISDFGKAVRSRIRQTMSNGASCFAGSCNGWSNTVTSTPCSAFQSAYFSATRW